MFWERGTRGGMSTGNMAVAGGYVTPECKANLVTMGLSDTYADACSDVVSLAISTAPLPTAVTTSSSLPANSP